MHLAACAPIICAHKYMLKFYGDVNDMRMLHLHTNLHAVGTCTCIGMPDYMLKFLWK
jgi:hypothetical protein